MDSICVKIKHTCGHVETVNLMGKPASRERQIKRLETVPCMDCRVADIVAKREEIDGYFAAIAPDVANKIGAEYRQLRLEPLKDIAQSIPMAERGIDIQYRLYKMARALCDADSLREMAQVFLFHGDVDFWRSAFQDFPFQTIRRDQKTLINAFFARCKRYDTLSPVERMVYRSKK